MYVQQDAYMQQDEYMQQDTCKTHFVDPIVTTFSFVCQSQVPTAQGRQGQFGTYVRGASSVGIRAARNSL